MKHKCLTDEAVMSQKDIVQWLFPQMKPKCKGVRDTYTAPEPLSVYVFDQTLTVSRFIILLLKAS